MASFDELNDNQKTLNISGTELRRRLYERADVPESFSSPQVLKEFRKTLRYKYASDWLFSLRLQKTVE